MIYVFGIVLFLVVVLASVAAFALAICYMALALFHVTLPFCGVFVAWLVFVQVLRVLRGKP